jgi:single-stranded DNA-binding protein
LSTNVTLAGNLTRDPVPGNGDVTFTVATERRRRDEQGTWLSEGTTFWDCRATLGIARQIADCLSQGDRVIVTGRAEGSPVTVMVTDAAPSLKFTSAVVTKLPRRVG